MAKYTKVKIFNMALKNLGVSVGLQSTSQTDRNTVVLNEYYDTAREKTLADHDWSFASAFRELTPTGNTSMHPKFAYEYDYPNNCVFIREVWLYQEKDGTDDSAISFYNMISDYGSGSNIDKVEFEVASDEDGNKIIYTNVEPALVRFTRLVSEEVYYPPEFVMALSWYLAFLAAPAVTGARVKTSDCLQIYKKMLSEAAVADSNELYKKDEYECDWIEARN